MTSVGNDGAELTRILVLGLSVGISLERRLVRDFAELSKVRGKRGSEGAEDEASGVERVVKTLIVAGGGD
jgi:hypothetical protein